MKDWDFKPSHAAPKPRSGQQAKKRGSKNQPETGNRMKPMAILRVSGCEGFGSRVKALKPKPSHSKPLIFRSLSALCEGVNAFSGIIYVYRDGYRWI